jgi:hypothetical protein
LVSPPEKILFSPYLFYFAMAIKKTAVEFQEKRRSEFL